MIVHSFAKNTSTSNDEIDIVNNLVSCDDITGLTISNGHESTGVTTLLQEACDMVDVMGSHRKDSTITSMQADFQDLKEYFRRPRAVSAFPFTLGTLNGTLTTIDKTALFSTIFPNSLDRLEGVLGIRFEMVFTIQAAATPFHQGVVSLNWQYVDSSSAVNYLRASNSCTSTNIPHVRLDLSESTMATLRVPFFYPTEYLPINEVNSNTTPWSYGTLGMTVIVPVRAGATAPTPAYRIMMHLENLELYGAAPYSTAVVSLQSGKMKPINEEFEQDAYPYSSGLHAASRTLKWVAKGIPSISSLASPAAWALGKAAGVARYFGYSKPQIQEPINRFTVYSSVLEQNVDVPSATAVAGPMASNALTFSPEFSGTDVDEMALSYLLSRWGQIRLGKMTTSDAISTRLYVCPISPDSLWYRSSGAAPPYCNIPSPSFGGAANFCFVPSHVNWLASMFRYWRGDLEFRFTFAKTKFHGGRVIVQYTPDNISTFTSDISTISVPADTTAGPAMFGHSAIFDLRDGNQFTFTVPYTADTPYVEFFQTIGALSMSVLDPLLAPETVSNTIEFLVEVRGAPNFELASPVGPMYPAATFPSVLLQSGKMRAITSGPTDELCIGEHITSVKQLIMLPKLSTFTQAASATTVYWIPPWYWHPKPSNNTTLAGAYPSNAFSFGGNIAKAFLFVRGGTDLHAHSPLTGNFTHHAFVGSAMGNVNSAVRTRRNRSGMSIPRVIASNTHLHVRFPAYQRTVRVHNGAFDSTLWNPNDTTRINTFNVSRTGPTYIYKYSFTNGGTGTATILMSRAAADDAAMSHYMGPCPNLLIDSTATTVWDPDSSTTYQSGHMHVCSPFLVKEQEKPVSAFENSQSVIQAYNPTLVERMLDKNQNETQPLPRAPSGSLGFGRPRVSGDKGVSPANIAGKLTSLTHTLSPALLAAVQVIDAATEIANATQ